MSIGLFLIRTIQVFRKSEPYFFVSNVTVGTKKKNLKGDKKWSMLAVTSYLPLKAWDVKLNISLRC